MRLDFDTSSTAFPLVENEVHENAFSASSWDFDSLLKKGIAAAQSGDRDHARKLLSQATALNPASEDAWMWLASISDYPEELLAFLNRVLEINPANEKAAEWRSATNSLLAKTFVQRALAARNDGSMALASQCLEQALAHDENCEPAWFWKAALAASDDQKLEFYDRTLALNPENTDAAEAVEKINFSRTVARLEEASAFVAAGETEKAAELLEPLFNHESPEIRENAWLIMADTAGTDDEKVEFLNKVLEVNPANQHAQDTITAIKRSRSKAAFDEARSAAATGDRQKALDILDNFVKDVPDSGDAWLLKSHLSVSLDEKVEALEKALVIDPENAAARSGLAFLSLTFGSAPEQKEEVKTEAPEELVAAPVEETAASEEVFAPEPVETVQEEPVFAMEAPAMPAAESEAFVDGSVEESRPTQALDAAVEFAYRQTEETFKIEEPQPVVDTQVDAASMFEPEAAPAAEEDTHETVAFSSEPTEVMEFTAPPEPHRSVEEMFGPVVEDADPSTETMDSLAPFVQEALNPDPFISEAPVSHFDRMFEEPAPVESPAFFEEVFGSVEQVAPAANACPFCFSPNDAQAFECVSCNATLTLSDLEKLLAGTNANREIVQNAVTSMEAEWNMREFSEAEFTALAIGHFNLGNSDAGFRYLQEACRLNPNNVILSGQVNTIAIRMEEMRRQSESHLAMPKGKKILVVDDSPTVRKLISGKLEKSGHLVVCAVDGVDALAKLDEGMPDLVLLDITMPRMDGYEVCKQIRANPAGKNLPVVMISGKDGFFDKVRGRMAGTSGYVTKPFGPETLMKALETYLLPDEVEVS
ncbi:MAG TPA: response regulator [Pyrinomonadaceae bacterium]|nr:response regulator [Pyrinomonadaceae bacterium]